MKKVYLLLYTSILVMLAVSGVSAQDQMGIYGIVINDVNADSAVVPGSEPGLSGWVVFLDDNNNGVLDPGEEWTTTDASGQFTFVTRKRCTTIRVQIQPGWTVTYPPAPSAYRVCDGAEVLFGLAFSELEFGDLPDPPYRTTLATNGARHGFGGPFFGKTVDMELDGQPDATATGDDVNGDDEDGITVDAFRVGAVGKVRIQVKNVVRTAFIKAWVDFDGDGDLEDKEVIINDQVNADGEYVYNFAIPPDADSLGYSRFRISSESIADAIGMAPDGEVEDLVLGAKGELDYGDALEYPIPGMPQLPYGYPTTIINDGPRHFPVSNIRLGFSPIDGELGGQTSRFANGDDILNLDDEDGIRFQDGFILVHSGPDPDNPNVTFMLYGMTRGYRVKLTPLASVSGNLNLWIDWNRDGDWDDAGEQVFDDEPVASGPLYTPLYFKVPDTARIGLTFARFRFSTDTGLDYTGGAVNGEVEDYLLEILPETDHGDAPDPYPTLRVDNGAWQYTGGYYLGAAIDGELDGIPHMQAKGDDSTGVDDEDGIAFLDTLVPGQTARIQVRYNTPGGSGTGYLSAWVDFDHDFYWDDSTEKVLDAVSLANSGVDTLSFLIPTTAVAGTTYARFRFVSHSSPVQPTGPTPFDPPPGPGEVEDYEVVIKDTVTAVESLPPAAIPKKLILVQNYPNPFNPETRIQFGLPADMPVKLEVFDLLGNHVATLVNERLKAGYHEVRWKPYDLPSGMYVYRLTSPGGIRVRKMLYLK